MAVTAFADRFILISGVSHPWRVILPVVSSNDVAVQPAPVAHGASLFQVPHRSFILVPRRRS